MEADWEVEVGGGAPVIEAHWAGLVDLRENPERIAEIAEAIAFPPLGRLLGSLNAAGSPVWSAKCDVWQPEVEAFGMEVQADAKAVLACYVDLLPRDGEVFATLEQAEKFCRAWCARLEWVPAPGSRVDLILRQALVGHLEGFGISAYATGAGADRAAAARTLAVAIEALANAIPPALLPNEPIQSYNEKGMGE